MVEEREIKRRSREIGSMRNLLLNNILLRNQPSLLVFPSTSEQGVAPRMLKKTR